MTLPLWSIALGATLGMQIVASLMNQALVVVAPLLMADAGLAPERIGILSSLASVGTVLFLAFGSPLLARFGPVRMLQVGTACCAGGLLLVASSWWPLLLLGAVMIGIGYGPSPPAGSRILAASAPPGHRTLIFSVKQAGAPAGAALAGFLLAPAAVVWGWPAAIVLSLAAGAVAALSVGFLRDRLDVEREPDTDVRPRALFRPRALAQLFGSLRGRPGIVSTSLLAGSFAIVQGSLQSFTVTYLAGPHGFSLVDAGFAYACLQGSGMFARVFLGWLADFTGRPAANLAVQAFVAAGLMLLFAALPQGLPIAGVALVAGAVGFVAASWNGIYMAEIARLAPPGRIAEATAASALITFTGYAAGPALVSLLITATGDWGFAFAVVAAQLALIGVVRTFVLVRTRAPQ